MNKIVVLVGPTSSGKTSLAQELCKKYNGAIVSADSRQVCKYMDIGTGKGSAENTWGYDLVKPDQYFSAYDYANLALEELKRLIGSGRQPFLVGGTGFYIDIVTGRLKVSGSSPDFDLRESLEKESLPELNRRLMSLNLEAFQKIDQKNKSRLLRAVEREMTAEKNFTPLPYLEQAEYLFIGLTAPNDFLFERVDRWLDSIWAGGLVEEVKKLQQMGFSNSRKLQGLVYNSVGKYLSGTLSEDQAKQEAKYDLHAYIRRQLTYFRKNKDIQWFDISKDGFREIIYTVVGGFIGEKC